MKKILSFFICMVVFTPTYADNTIADWQEKYYVDDFGDSTNKKYYSIAVSGTSDNAMYNNINLEGKIIIDDKTSKNELVGSLFLYEYGQIQVKNIFSDSQGYNVKIKYKANKPNAKIEYYTMNLEYPGLGDRINIYSWRKNEKRFLEDLILGGKFVMVLKGTGQYNKFNTYKLRFKSATLKFTRK